LSKQQRQGLYLCTYLFTGEDMTKDEVLRLALEALEGVLDDSSKVLEASISGGLYEVVQCRDAITAIKAALEAKDEPVQVSPLQFVEMVMEKEDCIGKPIFWAEWPNKEKNT
jgi:hypothetical protein|tara:strand:- start:421 stop:756 length:336 start_codon:yes stop_codon:yes gene_type:complete